MFKLSYVFLLYFLLLGCSKNPNENISNRSLNASQVPYEVIVDTQAPVAGTINNVISPSQNQLPLISWTKGEGVDRYDLYLSQSSLCADGIVQSFSDLTDLGMQITEELSEGTFYVCLFYRDLAGNMSPADNNGMPFVIDLQEPTIDSSISSVMGPETNSGTSTIISGSV